MADEGRRVDRSGVPDPPIDREGVQSDERGSCRTAVLSTEQADPAAVDLFAAALTTLWNDIARDQPDEPWKQALAASAQRWHEHRLAAVSV